MKRDRQSRTGSRPPQQERRSYSPSSHQQKMRRRIDYGGSKHNNIRDRPQKPGAGNSDHPRTKNNPNLGENSHKNVSHRKSVPDSPETLDSILRDRSDAISSSGNNPVIGSKEVTPPTPPPCSYAVTTVLDGEVVPRLDQGKPEHARRIQQRRRMIAFGKNTTGYDEYIKQVPRHKRGKYSMDRPSTPDINADIPTRRFQGMVKAWRKALHKYDPPDLAKDSDKDNETSKQAEDITNIKKETCIKTQQIEEATRLGVQVNFASENSHVKNTIPTKRKSPSVALKSEPIVDDAKQEIDNQKMLCRSDDEEKEEKKHMWADYEEDSDDDDLL